MWPREVYTIKDGNKHLESIRQELRQKPGIYIKMKNLIILGRRKTYGIEFEITPPPKCQTLPSLDTLFGIYTF